MSAKRFYLHFNLYGPSVHWADYMKGFIWSCNDEDLFYRACDVIRADDDFDPAAFTLLSGDELGDLRILADQWADCYDDFSDEGDFVSVAADRIRSIAESIHRRDSEQVAMVPDEPAGAEMAIADSDTDSWPAPLGEMYYLHVFLCGEGPEWPPNPLGWILRSESEELIERVCALMSADPAFEGDRFTTYSIDEMDDLWVLADEWIDIYEESPEEDNLWDQRAIRARAIADKISKRMGIQGAQETDLADQVGTVQTKRKRRRPGKPPITGEEEACRYKILDDWDRAKGAGVMRKEFCEDEGITTKELENIQRWANAREDRKG
jgi:hypothetical protein